MAKKKRATATPKFDARPDRADFRDRLYAPGLHLVPREKSLEQWQRYRQPVLDQGADGACTGFGLAVVANFLMGIRSAAKSVSPRMLYEMAKDYDEWPGDTYEGSSCKGAVKGWHKHGVCTASLWPHMEGQTELNEKRAIDAAQRPLGTYYRLNAYDINNMHAAIAEVGVIYASGDVTQGWFKPKAGVIQDGEKAGGHAFAIVGYNARGFWIQNS